MRLIKLLGCALLLFSCDKSNDTAEPINDSLSNGALVLCEGLFQHNNSQLSYISFANQQVENNFFLNRNGRQLGDTGNDLKRYGGKIYIIVNVSSTVEVVDAKNFESLKQISMMNGTTAKQPRSIAFYNGNAYVTCFDGYVDVIDTASLNITERIEVGANPERMAIANGKLFVTNSGGLNAPLMDSTVSVIDLSTHQELQKITVGLNPGSIERDESGDIYVVARGNYSTIPSVMSRIDSQNEIVSETFDFNISGITKFNGDFLLSYYDFTTMESTIGLFNTTSESMTIDEFMSLEEVTTLYTLTYNPGTQKIYVSDAMGYTNTGYIREYDNQGNYTQSFHVGLNPSKILFYE